MSRGSHLGQTIGELLDEVEEMGIADHLCRFYLFQLAGKGDPAHPLGLPDVLEDAVTQSNSK